MPPPRPDSDQIRLPLNAGTDDFAGFYAPRNGLLIQQLRELAANKPGVITFDGPAGSGKSHLLRATAAAARRAGLSAAYVSLEQHTHPPDWLQPAAVVCIDALQRAAQQPDWGLALLELFEAQRTAGGGMALATVAPLNQLNLAPPDLLSRLQSGQHHRLLALDEAEQREALIHSAKLRGFILPPAALNYIRDHHPRDTASLFALLERIERQAIRHRRRVTLALVRDLCA